jgi:hypothetical protein
MHTTVFFLELSPNSTMQTIQYFFLELPPNSSTHTTVFFLSFLSRNSSMHTKVFFLVLSYHLKKHKIVNYRRLKSETYLWLHGSLLSFLNFYLRNRGMGIVP